jgi:hypothetical protein
MRIFSYATIGLGLLLLASMALSHPQDPKAAGGRYVGAETCKNCHNGKDKGDMFDHWSQTPHANAFKTLAGAKAKQVAKELGIDDPQKSQKCLKCHVTAYGVDAKLIKASFKAEHGVQCESCHGPGENHQKKRMKEAMQKGAEPSPIDAAEVTSLRSPEACTKCHNQESPTYKPFCLVERMTKIEHLDPRKNRSEDDLKKLRATCAPDCEICKAAKEGNDK